MARFVKKQKKEIGLSPDELVFRGEQKIEHVLLRIIDFDATDLKEDVIKKVGDALKYQNQDTVTWFNIDGLHNIAIMNEIGKGFNLDNLILADVLNTHARPKVQEYPNGIFISVKMLQMNETTGTISAENLSLMITKSVLISFQEKKGDVFEPIRERIRNQKKRIRNSGTDYLAFSLLDIIIDNYIYILSVLGEKIESLEEDLLLDPKQNIIDQINFYKRELNFIRKTIHPAKEMILALSKIDTEFIEENTSIHYKELVDNINHATETSDSYREILSDQLNIYHSTMSTKLNDIMKFLTVFSVLFIPLTFIAGVYGTNFDNLPGIHGEYGYITMWVIIVIIAVGMLLYFKKKRWL